MREKAYFHAQLCFGCGEAKASGVILDCLET
jgi:hypothetical protein